MKIGLLTLILLTWNIWWAPNNASKWQMGFNSAFEGLNTILVPTGGWGWVAKCDHDNKPYRSRKRAVNALPLKVLPADVEMQMPMSSQRNVTLQRQWNVIILSDILFVTSIRLTRIISLAHWIACSDVRWNNGGKWQMITCQIKWVCNYTVGRRQGSWCA